jgi:hypothetical protein
MTWGIEGNVAERFAAAGVSTDRISFERDVFTFNAPLAPKEFVAVWKTYYGPTMSAFEAAEKNGRTADLQRDLVALFEHHNRSPQKDAITAPATFLRVTVAL